MSLQGYLRHEMGHILLAQHPSRSSGVLVLCHGNSTLRIGREYRVHGFWDAIRPQVYSPKAFTLHIHLCRFLTLCQLI